MADNVMSNNLIQVDPKTLIFIFYSGNSHTPVATCIKSLDFDAFCKCTFACATDHVSACCRNSSDLWHASFKNQNVDFFFCLFMYYLAYRYC